MKRFVSLFVLFTFCFSNLSSSLVFAQTVNLPAPGTMVTLSAQGNLPMLKGLRLNPDNPLKMDFIIEPNGAPSVTKEDAAVLARYFLAALAMPKEDTWVNLSPYESQRIVPQALAETDLGKDLLGQDYILKQLASSLTYPETEVGKKYWDEINGAVPAGRQVGARSPRPGQGNPAPTNAFSKVWIIPNKASVYENGNTVLISESSLAVKTEEDYLACRQAGLAAQQNNVGARLPRPGQGNPAPTQAFKTHILPLIEQDVNTGKNFAQLRQIYSALILAEWFKNKFFDSFYHNYINQAKTKGITIDEKNAKDKIYALYLEAFKKGAYNYIKKESVTPVKITKRQYFSGGFDDQIKVTPGSVTQVPSTAVVAKGEVETGAAGGRPGSPASGRVGADHREYLDQVKSRAKRVVDLRCAELRDWREIYSTEAKRFDDDVLSEVRRLDEQKIRVGENEYLSIKHLYRVVNFVFVENRDGVEDARYVPETNTIEIFGTSFLNDCNKAMVANVMHELAEKKIIDHWGSHPSEAQAFRAHALADLYVQSNPDLALAGIFRGSPGEHSDHNLARMEMSGLIHLAQGNPEAKQALATRILHILKNFEHSERYYPIDPGTRADWERILAKFTALEQFEQLGVDITNIYPENDLQKRVTKEQITTGEAVSLVAALAIVGGDRINLLAEFVAKNKNIVKFPLQEIPRWLNDRGCQAATVTMIREKLKYAPVIMPAKANGHGERAFVLSGRWQPQGRPEDVVLGHQATFLPLYEYRGEAYFRGELHQRLRPHITFGEDNWRRRFAQAVDGWRGDIYRNLPEWFKPNKNWDMHWFIDSVNVVYVPSQEAQGVYVEADQKVIYFVGNSFETMSDEEIRAKFLEAAIVASGVYGYALLKPDQSSGAADGRPGSPMKGDISADHQKKLDRIREEVMHGGKAVELYSNFWDASELVHQFHEGTINAVLERMLKKRAKLGPAADDVVDPDRVLRHGGINIKFFPTTEVEDARYDIATDTIEFFGPDAAWVLRVGEAYLCHEIVEAAEIKKNGKPHTQDHEAWRGHSMAVNYVQSQEDLAYGEFYGEGDGRFNDQKLSRMTIEDILAVKGQRQKKIIAERVRYILLNYAHAENFYKDQLSLEMRAAWRRILEKFTSLGQFNALGVDLTTIYPEDNLEKRNSAQQITTGEAVSLVLSLALAGGENKNLLNEFIASNAYLAKYPIFAIAVWLAQRKGDSYSDTITLLGKLDVNAAIAAGCRFLSAEDLPKDMMAKENVAHVLMVYFSELSVESLKRMIDQGQAADLIAILFGANATLKGLFAVETSLDLINKLHEADPDFFASLKAKAALNVIGDTLRYYLNNSIQASSIFAGTPYAEIGYGQEFASIWLFLAMLDKIPQDKLLLGTLDQDIGFGLKAAREFYSKMRDRAPADIAAEFVAGTRPGILERLGINTGEAAAGAAKKPSNRSEVISPEKLDKLLAKENMLREFTRDGNTFLVFKDGELGDNDAIRLGRKTGKHASTYTIAITEELADDGNDAIDALVAHETQEDLKYSFINAFRRPSREKTDWQDSQMRIRAHRFGSAQEVLAWNRNHQGELLPRHLRALKDPRRAAELVEEWSDGSRGWLARHKKVWEEEGFDPRDIATLEAYARLFNETAVGGEDFRGMATKSTGSFNKMELKGTDLGDIGNLNIEITAIVPFKP